MAGIIISWIIIGFALIRMAVSLVNVLSKLNLSKAQHSYDTLVSVLIPARNEAHNLPQLLDALRNQDHGNLEIIVYDDHSEDETAKVVKELANIDDRIQLMQGDQLPEGWLGKNYACHQMASIANGDYFLFLDADVSVSKDLISKGLDFVHKEQLALLSVFPKQQIFSIGERLTVPLMNWILLTLLPMILIRKSSRPSLAAANGQFMWFEKNCYKRHKWHEQVKDNLVEDIEIIRMMKEHNYNVCTLLGNHDISCRMYTSYKEGLNGFAKNVVEFFGGSSLMAVLFAIIVVSGVFIIPFYLEWIVFISYLIMIVLTRIFVSVASKQSVAKNLFFHIPQIATFVVMVFKGVKVRLTGSYRWKGRIIEKQ
jgi:chlorobactene glucosyltransferase